MNTPYQVQAIIAQMGGKQIFAMAFKACAYECTDAKTAVTFTVAPSLKKAAKCSHVRVTLDPSDTYTVEFLKVAKYGDVTTVYEVDGVYNDMLKPLVEKQTGLYLSL